MARERNRHPEWMERLVFNEHVEARTYAAIIDFDETSIAVEFPHIVEFVTKDRIKPLALLSESFCGVVVDRSDIYPIIAIDRDPHAAGHVMLVSDGERNFGLRFAGTPRVANLDQVLVRTDANSALVQREAGRLPEPLVAKGLIDSPETRAILLDAAATTDALFNLPL